MASSLLLMMMDPPIANSVSLGSSQNSPPSPSSGTLPPESVKFLYMSLHRVDNLVRQYHNLRALSNIQASTLAHLSSRLSALAHSSMAPSTRTIDYDNVLCPPRLSLADRMSISLKENIERATKELNTHLQEMELLSLAVDDTLISLCDLVNRSEVYSVDLERGVRHVQHTYFNLVAEVRARRDLWFQFTSDGKRKAFMAASTLGEVMVSPSVDWDAFAKEWAALGEEDTKNAGGEVDELTDAIGNWGKGKGQDGDGAMME